MVITISGAHGVGKTTLVRTLCSRHGVEFPPERKPNPFDDHLLSLLFYQLAFNERDTWASRKGGLVFLDRHSGRDILVDAWTLHTMGLLKWEQVETIAEVCKRVLLPFGAPAWSILLDDEPRDVMVRIRSRPLPAGHLLENNGVLLEYDEVYLDLMIRNFRREFESEAITAGEFGIKVAGPRTTVLRVNGRQPEALAETISDCLRT